MFEKLKQNACLKNWNKISWISKSSMPNQEEAHGSCVSSQRFWAVGSAVCFFRLIQRLPSSRRKHTICVLLPDPRSHKRSKETHHLIQRLTSALKKHTIRVLLQSRLVLPTGTKGGLRGHDSCQTHVLPRGQWYLRDIFVFRMCETYSYLCLYETYYPLCFD